MGTGRRLLQGWSRSAYQRTPSAPRAPFWSPDPAWGPVSHGLPDRHMPWGGQILGPEIGVGGPAEYNSPNLSRCATV